MANQGIRPRSTRPRSAAAKPKERPSAMKDATQITRPIVEGRIRRGTPQCGCARSDAGGPREGAPKARPVERSLAHHARRTPNQIRDDDPHFFGEEGAPDQRVRVPVVLEARAREQRRPDCRDEIGRDAYHEHGSRRQSRCARVAIWLEPLDLDHVVSVTEGRGPSPMVTDRSDRTFETALDQGVDADSSRTEKDNDEGHDGEARLNS